MFSIAVSDGNLQRNISSYLWLDTGLDRRAPSSLQIDRPEQSCLDIIGKQEGDIEGRGCSGIDQRQLNLIPFVSMDCGVAQCY